jgi:hypothetical protein
LAGDATASHDQFAALLPAHERFFSSDRPETLFARGTLAKWTGESGDLARDQLAALLPVMEQILDPEHQRTLTTRHWLAYWTERAEPSTA